MSWNLGPSQGHVSDVPGLSLRFPALRALTTSVATQNDFFLHSFGIREVGLVGGIEILLFTPTVL